MTAALVLVMLLTALIGVVSFAMRAAVGRFVAPSSPSSLFRAPGSFAAASILAPTWCVHGRSSVCGISSSSRRNLSLSLATPETLFPTAATVNGVGYLLLRNVKQQSLTPSGLTHAALLGLGLWTFLGPAGYCVCVAYLVLGSAVTKVRMKEKEREGIAEKRGGARGPENVWGSAAAAMLCALAASYAAHGGHPVMTTAAGARPFWVAALRVGYVAALATKLSDTFQSEIGKAFGRTTVLVTTLRRVPRGTEGAVSLEGYAAGVVGSALLALLALAVGVIATPSDVGVCMVASLIATTAESFIGAAFQSDAVPWLTNEIVNLINTAIGAAVGVAGFFLLN